LFYLQNIPNAEGAGGRIVEEDLDLALSNRGLLARLFRRFFRLVERSWHMYPLGVLFGLGFDTATEVGLLGISATQAAQGMSIWSIMVFPALFTAGMSLMDTSDSILMLGAYGWAFVKPIRKLYYNLTITAVSVVVAVVVGVLEALNLVGDQLGLTDGGGFWGAIGTINDNFGILGYVIVGIFAVSWLVSVVVYRVKRYDEIEVAVGRGASRSRIRPILTVKVLSIEAVISLPCPLLFPMAGRPVGLATAAAVPRLAAFADDDLRLVNPPSHRREAAARLREHEGDRGPGRRRLQPSPSSSIRVPPCLRNSVM
jgi:hypothetical protein